MHIFSFLFWKLDNSYSTLNERGDHSRTLDRSADLGETEPLKGAPLMVNPLGGLCPAKASSVLKPACSVN